MHNFSISLKAISFLFFLQIFLVAFPMYGQDENQIKVVYIANSGYLVETKSAKILIDAVFEECIGSYRCPDASTVTKLLDGREPFNHLDFVIVTHHHSDHFSASLMVKLMKARNDFKVICPEQVFLELQSNVDDPLILERIKSVDLDTAQNASFSQGDYGFHIARSKHADTYEIDNLCVIVDMNGTRILHTGDVFPESIEDIDPAFFNEIDLAIVPIGMSSDRFKVHDGVLSPKYTILSHIKDDIKTKLQEIMEQDSVTFRNKYVLLQPYDSKVFRFTSQ